MTGWRTDPDHPEWHDLPDWYDGPKGPSWDHIDVNRGWLWYGQDSDADKSWVDWVKRVAPDPQTGRGPVSITRHGESMSVEYYDNPYRIVGPFEEGKPGPGGAEMSGGHAATHHVHVNCSEVEMAPCWPPKNP